MSAEYERLRSIERKLDTILRLQGVTLEELKQIESSDAEVELLITKLKKSGDALKAATDANQPAKK